MAAVIFPSVLRARGAGEDAALSQTEPFPTGHGGDVSPRGKGLAPASLPLATSECIGQYFRERRGLTDSQVEEILLFQRQHNVMFGEAAVSLNMVTRDEVTQALARQFEFPYSAAGLAALSPELVVASDPFGAATENFRHIRSELLMGVLAPESSRRALAVLSVDSGTGNSFFAANLAVSLSQLGSRTLLLDGNLRAPRLHTLFRLPNRLGLSTLLAGKPQEGICSIPGLPSLFFLPSGATPPNPLELLERPALSLLLQDWFTRFDQIIVDAPASSIGADARVIAAKCGAALVVTRPGKTPMKPLQQLVNSLQKGPAVLAGVVINEH